MKIKIMLIEDNPEYRYVINLALQDDTEFDLIHVVGTAERALNTLQNGSLANRPDLLLLDLHLPGKSGIEALPELRALLPEAKIIILTRSEREVDVVNAITQGAAGYLLKSSGIQAIKNGIRTVISGGASLDVNVAKYILKALRNNKPEIQTAAPLTEREIEILELLAEGLVKKEIAGRLGISSHTVTTHVRHIYEKLEVTNAPAAVSKGYQSGIL